MYPTVELPEDPHQLSDEEMQWLTNLDHETCDIRTTTGRTTMKILKAKRTITRQEIAMLDALVRAKKLFCCMGGGNFGFGLATSFYRHPDLQEAQCSNKPLWMLSVTTDHFWEKDDPNEPEKRMSDLWSAFSPAFNSSQNVEMLTFYKLELPKPRGHYEY